MTEEPDEVVFRPMSMDDLDWISETERLVYPFPWSRRNFEDSFAAGYSAWIVAHGEERVGYAVLMLVMDEAHLLNISIRPDRQGQGFGARLLDHLCAIARFAHASQMFLEVRSSNAAGLRLYGKWGFAEIGCRRAYYPAVNGREDAIVMRRAL